MKKNVIALLLAVVLAWGSIGAVPAAAAETPAQESEQVQESEQEQGETDEVGSEEEAEGSENITVVLGGCETLCGPPYRSHLYRRPCRGGDHPVL